MDFFRKRGQSWTEKEVATKSDYVKRLCTTVFFSLIIVALVTIPEFVPIMQNLRRFRAVSVSVLVLVFALVQPLKYLTTLRRLILQRDGEPDTSRPSEMLEKFISQHERKRDTKASLEREE